MKTKVSFPCSQGPAMFTYPDPDKSSTPLHILILSIPPRLSLPYRLPTKSQHVFLSTSPHRTRHLSHLSYPPLLRHPNHMWREVQIVNNLHLAFLLLSKSQLHHLVPWSEWDWVYVQPLMRETTTTLSSRQNFSSLYFWVYFFLWQQKSDPNVGRVPVVLSARQTVRTGGRDSWTF
jgi:hypothetical protein